MKTQVRICFAWLISLLIIPQFLCDEFFDASKVKKLACICFRNLGNQSIAFDSKCSTSCTCSPGLSADRWTCVCSTDEDPEVTANILRTSCFTSCDCTLGLVDSSKIWIFSRSTVTILLIFGLLMTLAFIALVSWYTYQRNIYHVQGPLFSSNKDTCMHSASKFTSRRGSSASEYKVYIDATSKPITGCIRTASFLFRSKREIIVPGTLERFSYSELVNATEKFSISNLIGVGGSSHVYRGHLRCGKTVAVKRLKSRGGPDFEAFFLTEIELISRLHHCHVVPLLGYCSENQGKHVERLLVFEYMHNGNLRECLDGAFGKFLDWNTRVTIALGVAKGLEYLHEAAAPKILHRDVKSTNVLLDDKLRAKITDLGTATHLRADGLPSCHSSPARMQGTFGYFAPEYAVIGRASLKSDVFSFGVVILELITGRQPINPSAEKGEASLVIWATPRLVDSKRVIMELPDPQLNGNFPEEELQIMAYLAKECLSFDPDSRPSMSEAVQILSTIAPEISTRKNISISLFQNSFNSIRSGDNVERADKHVETEEPKEVICSGSLNNRRSLPLHIDRTLCAEKTQKEIDTFSRDIDRLLLLITKASHLHSQEDEVVDMTKPKYESFCIEYARSSV